MDNGPHLIIPALTDTEVLEVLDILRAKHHRLENVRPFGHRWLVVIAGNEHVFRTMREFAEGVIEMGYVMLWEVRSTTEGG